MWSDASSIESLESFSVKVLECSFDNSKRVHSAVLVYWVLGLQSLVIQTRKSFPCSVSSKVGSIHFVATAWVGGSHMLNLALRSIFQ